MRLTGKEPKKHRGFVRAKKKAELKARPKSNREVEVMRECSITDFDA
jgi:hypothetical protein